MVRQLPVEYPGALYRVICRGERPKNICLDDAGYQETMAKPCQYQS